MSGSVTKRSWNMGRVSGVANKLSDPFELKANPDIKFALFFRSKKSFGHACTLGIRLVDLGCMPSIDVHVKMWIQSSDGTKGDDHIVGDKIFYTIGDTCQFAVLSDSDDFQACRQSHKHGYDLVIHCELERFDNPASYAVKILAIFQATRQVSYEAYKEGVGTDVIIQADGKEFKVSSLILVAQSEVFKRMLSGSSKEATSKTIQIEKVTAQSVESFLRYLHLDTIEDDDPIEELFELGRKYMISDLRVRCAHLMTKSLSVENAAHRLVLSLRHNEEPLERYILKFIAMAGPSTQKLVYTSDVWYEYLHSQAQT